MLAGAVSAAIITLVGAAIGALFGSSLGAVIGAAVGLAVGGAYGWMLARAGSYGLNRRNFLRFLVDHTWSLPNTLVGSLFLFYNLVIRNELNTADSRRSSTVVFTRGVIPNRKRIVRVQTAVGPATAVQRTYFATTIGNVKVGVRPDSGEALKRHEDVHVFQARLFGPLYIPLVGLGFLVAILLPYWLLYHDRHHRPIRSFRDYFMRGVYPHTWHEEWAYSVGGTPP
jgi:hypothetical protein